MPTISTWIFIGLISLVISVIIRIVAEKSNKNSVEIAAIVIIPIVGNFFSDSDPINVRSIVIAYSLFVYLVCTLICHLIVFLVKKCKSILGESVPQEGLTVVLPRDAPFRIDQGFIDNLPADVDSLTHMCYEVGVITSSFTEQFPTLDTDQKRAELIRSYFLGICYHLLDLFDDSVRVHVRILKKLSEMDYIYEKYVATFNKKEYQRAMKPMSANNKMILTSYQNEQSLIASLNKSLCEPGSRQTWKNFMTFALRSVTYEGKPVFSMGISTARVKTDRLFFLNYCCIETIIERYVEIMVSTKGCKDFIIKHYFSSS